MESVSNYIAEKRKVRGVAPLFSKLVIHAPGNYYAQCAESYDEDRADVFAIGDPIGEIACIL